ncbi:hypothetical protein DFJ58DRAFT_197241 [Suillus subalutaceus]|uniref:uncharacterized protein n=1 Tax=Suillus subalutaceus TaxID=48586 RepID=UPI001B884544|nr:uncharacterized protein DFJ58DRAFT_197241 [Suillus subalutaceus]KAG1864753.1 hypothetical protein DFJ58DRAFT_197241 [Suillus subalutaceus]
MDVLPAQASSVPSERIFPSSKETCTLRRSDLSPTTLEALSMMFFTSKTASILQRTLVADERDYTISEPVAPGAVDELTAPGNLRKLENARDIDCN